MNEASHDRFALVVDEWFDGERRHAHGPSTLRVAGGRLVDVAEGDHGAALAAQGWPVQRGAFLMPGLVDAHVHLFLDGATTAAAERAAHLKRSVEALTEAARSSARQTLRCGVTRVRDAGDRHGINHRLRAESMRPDSGMARVRSSGLGIRRAKGYGAFMAREIDDEARMAESVARLAADNDEIKLILTGIIDFDAGAVTDEPQFSQAAASAAVRTAHEHGCKLLAHCSGAKGLAIAVAAGVDSIEHGFFIDRAILERMRDTDLAWTPTFCPVHFQWVHPEVAGWPAAVVGNLRRILDAHAEQLLLAHRLGVRLLVGTDAGSMGVEHGRAVADEIDRFVEAGVPLEAALAAVTSVPRRHFGDPHPVLAPGAVFEAVLLGASPFAEPRAVRRPREVWVAGRRCEGARP